MPSSYAIGEHFEEFIKGQLASGRYASASEVVRDALRLLEEQKKLRELRDAEIRSAIQESRSDARPPIPAEEVFARLEARYQTWAEKGQPG